MGSGPGTSSIGQQKVVMSNSSTVKSRHCQQQKTVDEVTLDALSPQVIR